MIEMLFWNTINICRRLFAILHTAFTLRQYRKMHKAGKESVKMLIGAHILGISPELWRDNSPHPLHHSRIEKHREDIANRELDFRRIAFGDSLKDIPKDQFTTVPEYANFAISGSRAHQMVQMMRDVHALMGARNAEVEVIFIGTLEGNGFLVGIPFSEAVVRSREALATARSLWPKARIVVDELPPTYNPWANIHNEMFEAFLQDWARADGNAVTISFDKQGKWTPNSWLSSDGVHHTKVGTARFDGAMQKAIDARPGSTVYA